MRLIFLALAVYIYGYFCDICIAICNKLAETALKKGKSLCGKGLVLMSNFASGRICRWQKLENRFITLSVLERNF